jgi:sec-independent protein translocase protein TatB
MFDIGWSEMLLIIVVMIIVIGPKDLPRALYTLGQWVGKVRSVARQFQDSIEQMAHQTGVDEVRKEIEQVGSIGNFEEGIEKTIDPKGEIKEAFDIKAPSLEAPPRDDKKPAKTEPAKPTGTSGTESKP